MPIFFFEGRYDLNAPAELAAAYFDRIDAPRKQLVWFEAGHLAPLERPGETLFQLVNNVRSLAVGAEPHTSAETRQH